MMFLRSCVLAICAAHGASAQNEIFADFVVTDGPDTRLFTIRFDHADSTAAPQAVANFIGLATGSRPWFDSATGEIRNDPFFDGMGIHQVSPDGFVAFGSRDGSGTDDAGWIFPDDFRSNFHDTYSVYFDNSGIPNNNGSRLFITIPAQPSLQGIYTRIGRVENTPFSGQIGTFNVQQISLAPTNMDGTPVPAVTIDSVTIRRVGAAIGFDETTWFLPTVEPADYKVVFDGSTWRLRWSETPGFGGNYFGSTDLVDWSGPDRAYAPPGAAGFGLDIGFLVQNPLTPRSFFRGSAVHYPFWPSTEIPLPNATIRLNFIDPDTLENITLQLDFDAAGTAGVWTRFRNGTIFQGSGLMTDVVYTPVNPFKGTLTFTNDTAFPNSSFELHFDYEGPVRAPTDRFSGGEANDNADPGDDRNFSGFWDYIGFP